MMIRIQVLPELPRNHRLSELAEAVQRSLTENALVLEDVLELHQLLDSGWHDAFNEVAVVADDKQDTDIT